MDRLLLEDVRFYGHHGVTKAEQTLGVWFSVDVELALDLAPAALSDDLGTTIDYGGVAQRIVELGGHGRVNLLERLAGLIAEMRAREYPTRQVRVRVRKLSAPSGASRHPVGRVGSALAVTPAPRPHRCRCRHSAAHPASLAPVCRPRSPTLPSLAPRLPAERSPGLPSLAPVAGRAAPASHRSPLVSPVAGLLNVPRLPGHRPNAGERRLQFLVAAYQQLAEMGEATCWTRRRCTKRSPGNASQGGHRRAAVASELRHRHRDLAVTHGAPGADTGRGECPERERPGTPEEQRSPRTMDIDILFYEDRVLSVPDDLHIPHLLLHERGFVLRPLADIAPDLEHPILYQTIRELVEELSDEHEVRPAPYPRRWFEG
jgi:dihydroneopterin aldolase